MTMDIVNCLLYGLISKLVFSLVVHATNPKNSTHTKIKET